MDERAEVKELIHANRKKITADIDHFWRRNAEDLISAGIPKKAVIESMMAVAHTQGMILFGATEMADRMHGCAEIFERAAKNGCERPASQH